MGTNHRMTLKVLLQIKNQPVRGLIYYGRIIVYDLLL